MDQYQNANMRNMKWFDAKHWTVYELVVIFFD